MRRFWISVFPLMTPRIFEFDRICIGKSKWLIPPTMSRGPQRNYDIVPRGSWLHHWHAYFCTPPYLASPFQETNMDTMT